MLTVANGYISPNKGVHPCITYLNHANHLGIIISYRRKIARKQTLSVSFHKCDMYFKKRPRRKVLPWNNATSGEKRYLGMGENREKKYIDWHKTCPMLFPLRSIRVPFPC